jgi:GNAT superfamily N-acetyltransferase
MLQCNILAMRVFRKLWPMERSKLRDHILRLSGPDRLRRFSGTLSDEAVSAYCDRIAWQRGYVIGCFIEGQLRAVAELRFDDPYRPGRAETAISVATQWQGQGIGAELLRYAVTVARNRSARTLYMICLTENERMQHIVRYFTDALRFRGAQAEADIALPFPTFLSLCTEAAVDASGLIGAVLEQFGAPWSDPSPASATRHSA